MRAPFQILAIPYRKTDAGDLFGVFCRADSAQWQFIAGGGEDQETPLAAAKREIAEETGVFADEVVPLTSCAYLPISVIAPARRAHWDPHLYVILEYAFAFACPEQVTLSSEHSAMQWLSYPEAEKRLQYDSNRTALYELYQRLQERKNETKHF